MKITAEQGKADKIHIIADGEYAFTVDKSHYYSMNLRDGDEISDEHLEEIKEEAVFRRCYMAALSALSRKAYSERELCRKLSAKFPPEAIGAAMEKTKELMLVNDEEYAKSYAEELSRVKGYSEERIVYELVQKGIERETARDAAGLLELDPAEKIIELLNTKFAGRLDDEKGIKQAIAALQRLGYRFSDIKEALRGIE
ncbi:MAG: recombination regulator RecX [Oscillospiraceae bacterium]|nr:recombination regulator RecX [Oscillospiraceae bacterium]